MTTQPSVTTVYCDDVKCYKPAGEILRHKAKTYWLKRLKDDIAYAILHSNGKYSVKIYKLDGKNADLMGTYIFPKEITHDNVEDLLFSRVVDFNEYKETDKTPFKVIWRVGALTREQWAEAYKPNDWKLTKWTDTKDKALESIGKIIGEFTIGDEEKSKILSRAINAALLKIAEYKKDFVGQDVILVYAIWINYNPDLNTIITKDYDDLEPLYYTYEEVPAQ